MSSTGQVNLGIGTGHRTEGDLTTLPAISVVIPVYRGAGTIAELLDRLLVVLEDFDSRSEVILVNDESPDNSWLLIVQAAKKYRWVRGIDLMKNSGQHNALLCGVRAAKCDFIVTMDDDLQHPPEQIPALLARLEEGFDLVYCAPFRETRGQLRNHMSKLVKKVVLSHTVGQDIEITSYRIFRSSLRLAFPNVTNPNVYLDLMLSWGARRIGVLRTEHAARANGTSTYTFPRLIQHGLNMLTSFSVLPLHLTSWLGFIMMGFGVLILVFVLVDFVIRGRVAPGFTFISSALAIFSGVQLFSIGIVGLYLARMYEGHLAKPAYIVRQEIGGDTVDNVTS